MIFYCFIAFLARRLSLTEFHEKSTTVRLFFALACDSEYLLQSFSVEELLKNAELLFSRLDRPSRELLLKSISGFRESIACLSASPTLSRQLERLAKNHISAFILVVLKILQTDGPKKLFDEIGTKSKKLCPSITEAINARFTIKT